MSVEVVITGIGVISPLGNEASRLFDQLMLGHSGIRLLGADEGFEIPVAAGAVEFDPAPWFTRLQLSGVDRTSQMAVAAACMARSDAALDGEPLTEAGIYMGCGMGGAVTLEQAYTAHFSPRPRVSPLTVVGSMTNAPAAHIGIRFGAQGPTLTYSVACASSAIALGEAYRAIARREIDVAIAGGAEALLVPGVVRAWQAMQTLARADADHPEAACRPFAQDRSGLVLAEGAAVLVLENAERARARGARIYARIAGFGMSSDASHITAPAAQGQVRAMRNALRDAGLAPMDIGYCNAHGTATKIGDRVECEALRTLWGDQIDSLYVSSTKSMHGHLLGGAGAMEAAVTTLAISRRQIPPTAHCDLLDEDCKVNVVRKHGVSVPNLNAAISNSFAFGGSNAVLVFVREE